MSGRNLSVSKYKGVWLFAFFDLPVDTAKAKKNYVRFRRVLLNNGFTRLQFSVYAKFCAGEESAVSYRRRMRNALPPQGEVRLLHVTDIQFSKMEVFSGKKESKPEEPPRQLLLF